MRQSCSHGPGWTYPHDGAPDLHKRALHVESQMGIAVTRIDVIHGQWRDKLQPIMQRTRKEQ